MTPVAVLVVVLCAVAWYGYEEYKIHQDPLIYLALLVTLASLILFILTYKSGLAMTLHTAIYSDGKRTDTEDILMRAVAALLIAADRDADTSNVQTQVRRKGEKWFPQSDYKREVDTYSTVLGQGLPGAVDVKNDPKGKIPAFVDQDNPADSIPEHTYSVSYDTAYGYSGYPGGTANLHALAIIVLNEMLPEGVSIIAWRNEFTYEVHEGVKKEDLANFIHLDPGHIDPWYEKYAVPAIDRAKDLLSTRP